MNLALILDKSPAYINYMKDSFCRQWGVDSSGVHTIDSFSQAGGMTLFGDTPTYMLWIENKDALNPLYDTLQGMTLESLSKRFPSGLVLASTMNRNSLKKLVKLVKERFSGVVQATGSDKLKISESLIRSISLNADAHEFLSAYAGENYEMLIPLVSSIEQVPREKQHKISADALVSRLPQPPGTVPAWEVSNAIFNGDAPQAIDNAHRSGTGSTPYLLPLYYIRTKVELLYRVSALLLTDPHISRDNAAKVLNIPSNYGVTLILKKAKRLSFRQVTEAVNLVREYDGKMRGGKYGLQIIPVDGRILLETLIVEITSLLED